MWSREVGSDSVVTYREREPLLIAYIEEGRYLDPSALVTTCLASGAGYLRES